MPLYPRTAKPFDLALFANPTAEYRGTPFWSWNNTLDIDQLRRQLPYFQEMGFGGAHVHCRTGLGTPYLSREFLDIVRACTLAAKDLGLLTWLYDEDRWPSGFAGGLVTKDPQYRAKHLLFTPSPYEARRAGASANDSAARSSRTGNGKLLARYEVALDDAGRLASYRRLGATDTPVPNATIWYAYLETATPSNWFNKQTYVDTLSRPAIERFIEVTHERYKRAVGEFFGREVPAIFTDEPQFAHKTMLPYAAAQSDVILPWTTDLPDTYRQAHAADVLDTLPEVIWDLPAGAPSRARWRYHDHVAERFAAAFSDTIGRWCRDNGLPFTGHMMEEATLTSQTHALGEAMRSYRAFDIPGIDMLCDSMEYTTAKQAQSAAHQYCCPGVMSELYGVTGWHFDFVGHKRQGDWQAALGVTVRVPHLAWVSMAGESKRDYPAAIGYQSPWYREYKLIEDHFSRVNVALTRGRPVVRVGVIHPIESFWLAYGPSAETQPARDQREAQFRNVTDWLLFASFDFNFICESLLPTQPPPHPDTPGFHVGNMAYDVVIVPGMRTIRSTTLERLEAFADAGGAVIFLGEIPSLVDVTPSDRTARLAARAVRLPFDKVALLETLEPFRTLKIEPGPGPWWGEQATQRHSLLYQLREDAGRRFLFACNVDRDRPRHGTRIEIRGEHKAFLLDTFHGTREPAAADYITRAGDTWTRIAWDAPAAGSVLLELAPGRQPRGVRLQESSWEERARIEDPTGSIPVTLSEPNVLLLDQAHWRTDDGPWNPLEEILRIDNLARTALGIPQRDGHMPQPWVDQRPDPVVGTLELLFDFASEVAVESPALAIEEAGTVELELDGRPVANRLDGWWVDESIRKIPLPSFAPGRHQLVVRIPMNRRRNVEWCYLLGDFGVRVAGRYAVITRRVRRLAWGDWTSQGLPFYAGNVTYHCTLPRPARAGEAIDFAQFQSPVMAVAADGTRIGFVAVPPFRVPLPTGAARVDITAYGNRANAFGIVHNTNRFLRWYGPNAWRSTGDQWSYEYQLRPMGVVTAPTIKSPPA